jgi:hypothetical protein
MLSDKDFVKKRIAEQEQYIVKIVESDLPVMRRLEIVISAVHQLIYFKSKL